MIQIVLAFNREIMNFLVKDREIYYTDRKWKAWIRCMPLPKNFIKQVKLSRNKIPASITDLFNFTEEEMKEYNNAKTEKKLAEIIIKDAKLKGCKLVNIKEKNESG